MTITIHRGIDQIGGCITEIATARTRILIDFGQNLPNGEGVVSDELATHEVVGNLTRGVDAIFYTHYHDDHIGLFHLVPDGVPQYIGQVAKQVALCKHRQLARIKDQKAEISALEAMGELTPGQVVRVGDIKVTPFFVNHSAYDAYMFLIEADGRCILHTGDFRGHGYLSKGLPAVIKSIGKVDFLITEGTMLSRLGERVMSENDLQKEAARIMTRYKNVFVMCSSTDMERLASFKAANEQTHRPLVCDRFQKSVLAIFSESAGKHSLLFRFDKVYDFNSTNSKLLDWMTDKGFCMFVRATDKFTDWCSELYYNPKKYHIEEPEPEKPAVVELFDEFLSKHKLSEVRAKNYRVIKRGLQRYELYVRATKRGQKGFRLCVDDVTPDTLRDIWDFFESEHKYFEQYPAIYESIPEKRTPQPRGRNTLLDCFSRIRTFFYWCNDNKKTTNKPFDDFPLEECTYGTPYYITIEERNKIYTTNLSRHPQLAIQRDIFVFQCLIGCRVGDLIKMTKGSVINGAIEYIPRKTKEGRPLTVRVPLNDIAREIVERYSDHNGDKLLPFISEQKYNVAIKRIFMAAGLKRMVTVVNPTTREEEKRVLYEIASSHLARRTFVGNLYKQVKDPNLVGSLSGHKEGSKAFARYREIDEQMKRELVDLLK